MDTHVNRPLLSLCIPTYNRGEILRETLDTIVLSPDFDDRVEVVICDNCSTDNTREISQEYGGEW